MLYFVIVCKSLKVCWVCIYALPCCSSLSNWHVEKQWCSSLCSGTHLAANLCDEIRLWMYRKMHQEAALGIQEWGRTKPFCEQECPNILDKGIIWLIFFFLLIKLGQYFYWGQRTTGQCMYMMPRSQSHLKIYRIWCSGGDYWCHTPAKGTQETPLPLQGKASTSQRS